MDSKDTCKCHFASRGSGGARQPAPGNKNGTSISLYTDAIFSNRGYAITIRTCLLSFFLLLFAKAALAVSTCEANFAAVNQPDGIFFITSVPLSGLDIHDAMQQLQAIATADGYVTASPKYQGSEGHLSIAKRETFDSQDPFIFYANKDKNEISAVFRAKLNSTIKPEDVRNTLCSILVKVKTSK